MEYMKFILLHILLCNFCFTQEVEFYPSASLHNDNIQKRLKKMSYENNFVTEVRNNVTFRSYNDRNYSKRLHKRATDTVFRGHPKTREEMWNERFLNNSVVYNQTTLISLIHNIATTYLNDCIPIILYDSQIKSKESYLFQHLLKGFPLTFIHGFINDDNKLVDPKIIDSNEQCVHFILFLTDVAVSAKVLGKRSMSKVVLVARSSQWAVKEFLAGPLSRMFVNLLVVGQSFEENDNRAVETPYILYTHKLYVDGLGASQPIVLTSWIHGKFTRNVHLFPPKMTGGYAGHRFVVAAANQPPFVFRRIHRDLDGGNPKVVWDGIEIRLLQLLAERNNFSLEIHEPRDLHLGSGDAVTKEITSGRADVAVAGMYITNDRVRDMDITAAHSQDCAAFITLTSTALPRYRAILGPFHWTVWLALTLTYLVGIFPLAFSDKHTLRHLLNDTGEIENMFWYVFGTFTNCFTFMGKNSWSKTTKITTRLLIARRRSLLDKGLDKDIAVEIFGGGLCPAIPMIPSDLPFEFKRVQFPFKVCFAMTINKSQGQTLKFAGVDIRAVGLFFSRSALCGLLAGWYWIFTIIITSCYTGSIIAFVTLPIFPETVDSVEQLLNGFYRVGTLDHGGWERWFFNSSDKKTNKLLKKMEFVPDVESGIKNTTKAFFWSYAFLGSKAELQYIVQANFSTAKSKRAVLHISNECFVPFGIAIGFPNNSLYTHKLSQDIAKIVETGILDKISDDVRWDIQRSATGALLAVTKSTSLKITAATEKGLTLEDTQGMFLLLAAGFLMAVAALISEWMGGFSRRCRKKDSPAHSNSSRELIIPTPKSDIESEILITTTDYESKIHFDTRPSTSESRATISGEIINVTQDGIIIHQNFDVDKWEYRRSSSVDLDREVKEIFEQDLRRRQTISGDTAEPAETNRSTTSRGMFGSHLRTI